MKRRLRLVMFVCLVAALASAAVAYAHPSGGTRSSADAAFEDAAGDAGAAPDLRQVIVSHTAAELDFVFEFWSGLPTTGAVTVWLDSDANPSTGDVRNRGFDYRVIVDMARFTYGFLHWTGSAWASAEGGFAHKFGSLIYLGAYKADLPGSGDDINFAVSTNVSGDAGAPGDIAPDQGSWSESFAPTTLAAEGVTVGSVRAGGTLTVSTRVRRSDTKSLVVKGEGDVSCSATVGGRELTLLKSTTIPTGQGPTAECVWATAKRLKGKTIHGQISVIVREAFVVRKFSVRVR